MYCHGGEDFLLRCPPCSDATVGSQTADVRDALDHSLTSTSALPCPLSSERQSGRHWIHVFGSVHEQPILNVVANDRRVAAGSSHLCLEIVRRLKEDCLTVC